MRTIIVAYDDGRVIGRAGRLPWHIPAESRHFKAATMGGVVVMGRRTWESLQRPLQGRYCIVVSRNAAYRAAYRAAGAVVDVPSVEVAARVAGSRQLFWAGGGECLLPLEDRQLFWAGGGEVYREVLRLGLADRVLASEVVGRHAGDTTFPELPALEWQEARRTAHAVEGFDVVEYLKR